jgi:hypothetical protein
MKAHWFVPAPSGYGGIRRVGQAELADEELRS